MPVPRDEINKELLYKVLSTLYRYSQGLAVIEHPRNIERRSIDIAVRLLNGRRLLVKVAHDLERIPRGEVQELASLSSTLGVPALIVSEVRRGEPLLEGIAYSKGGLYAVSPETLESIVSGREEVYIKVEREAYVVNIDGEAMRRRRAELNLSLGDVAVHLGVSRRTVYEYEKETMSPTIEKAERLLKLLGEDIAKPIDNIGTPSRQKSKRDLEDDDKLIERIIIEDLIKHGYTVTHARRTVVDIAASKDNEPNKESLTIAVEHPPRKSVTLEKAYYMSRLSNIIDIAKTVIAVESSDLRRDLEKEGFTVIDAKKIKKIFKGGKDPFEEDI
jgi:putative transcriptional regulator